MNKKTLYGKEARTKILEGVKKISAAVKCTLGPLGRNVMISQSMIVDYGVHNLPIIVSKDGYTVAKSFDLADDPFEKAGVLMIKEATQKTVDQAGDGTTTCCVLAEAIVIEGMKLIEAGENPMDVKRGIDKGVEYVVEQLKKMATPIKGNIDRIRQIATVSANNDEEIGNWIGDAFEKIGDEGMIDIESSKGVKTEIKITQGYKWGKGFTSPLFINNKEKQICEFENPLILLYDKRIIHHTQIQRAVEMSAQKGKQMLIICEDATDEGLAFLAMNNIRGAIKCCVVKSPSFGELQRQDMEDIGLLTGASYISDLRGTDIKEVEFENFGTAKKVIITKDETVIIDGNCDKVALENQLNELRMNLAQAKTEDEKFPIEKRIAKLTGGVAVIQVGAATETEMKEKMDRVDDAVRATKAAISEGYIAGAGTSFLRIDAGGFLNSVLEQPLKQIYTNAGKAAPIKKWWKKKEPSILDKVKNEATNIGYNAKTDTIEDLVAAGIIDPVKVLRCALQNAASSAGMILTCEALICDTM